MDTRAKLDALAANLWWSWNPDALDVFRRLNPDAFDASRHNPLAALRAASESVLADAAFRADVDRVYDAFRAYMEATPRYGDAPTTAYFCMEYGLHESLPLYSGGLGILAGDHAKATSDLGLPFTAVGLLLREGYFQQHFDGSGWQQATYPEIDPAMHPLTLVTHEDGRPVTVTVHLGHQPLHLQAWRIDLGRTTMYLLDTDFDANPAELRPLTRRLYQGGSETRIQQEILLGVGGARLLHVLGLRPDVYHMNEGHCAFLTLELLRERLDAGMPRSEAEAWVRERCVFTTHTPVKAGHDRFSPDLFKSQMAGLRDQLGLSDKELLAYGRVNPGDAGESFTMTILGLNLSRKANGVSKLNGEVARAQWTELYPARPVSEVPIGHITNGIHIPTWTAPPAQDFHREHLGDWFARRAEAEFWKGVEEVPDAVLWQFRSELRRRLVDFAKRHAARQSLVQAVDLDPDVLTIGFARRFATYKRAPLLFHDVERAARLFTSSDRPIQVLYAGKAHPADEGGKRFIQIIFEMSQRPAFKGKLVFLENYDMTVGRMLVSGCDVWLNNPRRPMEASGTSGQKVGVHGGLNCSILDGWWPEGYNGQNGWAIGDESTSTLGPDEQDAQDARNLYHVLENSVIPTFYDRGADGLPAAWIARMKAAMTTVIHQFSAERMVVDYIETMYRAEQPVG